MDYSKYCSLTYNGYLLDEIVDGYMTINVDGRGVLGRTVDFVETAHRDGINILSQKIPHRVITVYYLMKAVNAKVFLNQMEVLHRLLTVSNDVEIKFGDEDYFRYGRLFSSKNPPYDQLQGIGSFDLIFQDPYKYATEQTSSGTGTMTFNPIGPSEPLRPIAKLTLAENTSKITLKNTTTGKSIVLNGAYNSGDVVIINPSSGAITRNGGNIKSHLDFVESDFFWFLVSHGDQITVTPGTTALELTYRRRLL